MTITLRPEHENLMVEAMRTGAYQSPDDVIGRSLEMLHSNEEWLLDRKDDVEARINRAFVQFECGEFLSAEDSRADMEKRKGEWVAK